MPGIYILLDVAVSATPRRLLHAYHPMLFIIVYTLFNLTYYLCGGTVSGATASLCAGQGTKGSRCVPGMEQGGVEGS